MGLGLIDRAAMIAAQAHREHVRKVGGVPYIAHPAAVACELAAAGYSADCVAAALLHDVVEDTDMTLHRLHTELGAGSERAVALVRLASEPGKGEAGAKKRDRPWRERKAHLIEVASGDDAEAAALIVADKHHNLRSLMEEVETLGTSVWERMNAGPEQQRWLYHTLAQRTKHHDGVVFERMRETVTSAFGPIPERRPRAEPTRER